MNSSGARYRWNAYGLGACILLGLAVRIRQYQANTSLWHDESFIALNVLHTPVRGLFSAPDWNEPAPPGFLLLEKLVVAMFGSSEYAFRLVPHLVGLIALLAIAVLAHRVIDSERGRLYAVALFALSGPLIDQTNLVKHFSLDLCFAVVFATLALRIHATATPRAVCVWGMLGAIAPWVSYASVFSFGATSVTLAAFDVRQWDGAQRRAYLRAHAAPLISMALLLIPIHAQRTGVVVSFWDVGFPDTASVWRLAYWLVRSHLGLYHYVEQPVRAVGPLFAAAGALAWWRNGRRFELTVLWLPIVMAFIASCLRYWPFGGNQHMSFAAPAIMITIAVGIEKIVPSLQRWHRRAPAAALMLLFGPALLSSAYHFAAPRQRHDMRAAIRYAEQGRQGTDRAVVLDPATYCFYTGVDVRGQAPNIEPQHRVWIITPTSKHGELAPQAQVIFDHFNARPRLEHFQAHGAAAYLFGSAPPTS